ncbi:MAG: hypothetical protein L6V85_04620 [Clostridiales bacterium]|nr:MAG: hypothetical protein L6V85_04620 [Clostridiales bacterium]
MLYNPSMIYKGFLPFFDENSEILILGSFPSVISRETNFYYGNKQKQILESLGRSLWRTRARNDWRKASPA